MITLNLKSIYQLYTLVILTSLQLLFGISAVTVIYHQSCICGWLSADIFGTLN